jgi:prepilin signal peptidase PulO-like enzyme (type II secretory pathway)
MLRLLFYTLLLILLFFAARDDYRNGVISLWFPVIFLAVAVVRAVAGAVLTTLPFALILLVRRGSIGLGDVFLLIGCGFAFGGYDAVGGVIIGTAIFFIWAIVQRLRGRLKKKQAVPFAPFIAAGYAAIFIICSIGVIHSGI